MLRLPNRRFRHREGHQDANRSADWHYVVRSSVSLRPDHAKVDPEHVKVVAENDQVRVLRYRYEPHQKSAQHSHPDKTIDVALTKGRVRLISPMERAWSMPLKQGRSI
jgi:quercetin dioxygenase-like cupin family protein